MPIYSIDTKRIITALIRKENNRIATWNINVKVCKPVQTYSIQWILQLFSVNPSYSIFKKGESQAGLEPAISSSGGKRLIQLGYRDNMFL